MHASFIAFIVIGVIVVAIAAYRIGAHVAKAAKQESPDAQNNTPYEECLNKNSKAFKYGTFTDARDGETYHTVKIGNHLT